MAAVASTSPTYTHQYPDTEVPTSRLTHTHDAVATREELVSDGGLGDTGGASRGRLEVEQAGGGLARRRPEQQQQQ